MAKIHGFECDRCGEFYNRNRVKNPEDKTGYNVIGFAFVNTAKQLHRYDLCDDCLKELQLWINKPEAYVTEPVANEHVHDPEYDIPDENTESENKEE